MFSQKLWSEVPTMVLLEIYNTVLTIHLENNFHLE